MERLKLNISLSYTLTLFYITFENFPEHYETLTGPSNREKRTLSAAFIASFPFGTTDRDS